LKGKGGGRHQDIQETIENQAKVFSWKADIEERIGRFLETVDVGLRKGDMRVAAEISDATRVKHEIQNIKKCLEAGYDYILAVGPDDKDLSPLKRQVKKSFTFKEQERIRFYTASRVENFLSTISPAIVSEQIRKQKQRQKPLLNSTEAAEFLGIKLSTLYDWINQRKNPHIKAGGRVKFREEDLEKWLQKRFQGEEDFDILDE